MRSNTTSVVETEEPRVLKYVRDCSAACISSVIDDVESGRSDKDDAWNSLRGATRVGTSSAKSFDRGRFALFSALICTEVNSEGRSLCRLMSSGT
jgi:hypothetical protein